MSNRKDMTTGWLAPVVLYANLMQHIQTFV